MAARNPTPIGEKFNSLTILSEEPRAKRQNLKVLCRCDCGTVKPLYLYKMESGLVKSCGCGIHRMAALPSIGAKSGILEVLGPFNLQANPKTVVCRCGCGKVFDQTIKKFRDGAKSCGCLSMTHGHSIGKKATGKASRPYSIWTNMRTRCGNPNSDDYARYGARGITVCERWQSSFENFLEDMGEPPPGTSLDRKDNDLGYSKENCRWADVETQANNKRVCPLFEYEGESMTLTQWARKVGMEWSTLYGRIKRGWSLEKALNTPVRAMSRRS